MKLRLRFPSWFRNIIARARSPGVSDPSIYLPEWERRHGGYPQAETRMRVLWTGCQVAPFPVLFHEPSAFDRPRRHR